MQLYSVGQASGGPASAGVRTATSSVPSPRQRITWTTSASLIQRTLGVLDASTVENRKAGVLIRVFLVLALLQLNDGNPDTQFILYGGATLRSGEPFHVDGAYPMTGACSAKLTRAAALACDGSCRVVAATVAVVVRVILRRNATLGDTAPGTINPDVVISVANTVVDVSAPTGNSWGGGSISSKNAGSGGFAGAEVRCARSAARIQRWWVAAVGGTNAICN